MACRFYYPFNGVDLRNCMHVLFQKLLGRSVSGVDVCHCRNLVMKCQAY